jgi:hypothetical protein
VRRESIKLYIGQGDFLRERRINLRERSTNRPKSIQQQYFIYNTYRGKNARGVGLWKVGGIFVGSAWRRRGGGMEMGVGRPRVRTEDEARQTKSKPPPKLCSEGRSARVALSWR